MPDLNGGRKLASKSEASRKIDSSAKRNHSSSVKVGDKRKSGREPPRSPPKRRGVRRSRSSSSGTSDSSSSDSNSSDSSDSASSHSSKESPKKAVAEKSSKESKRPQPSTRTQKAKAESGISTKADDSRAQRELPKKSTSDASKPSVPVTRTDASQSRTKTSPLESTAVPNPIKSTAPVVDQKQSEPSPKSHVVSKSSLKPTQPDVDKKAKERSKSPACIPPFTRILVEKLTRNINKAHVTEIFSVWGEILEVEMPPDRLHPEFSRSYAYVTYKDSKSAADAVNFMNGGQIDGEIIRVTEIFSRPSTSARGDAGAVESSQYRDRGPMKRELDRPADSTHDRRDNVGPAPPHRRTEDYNERPRDRINDSDRRRDIQERRDRERERDRQRERSRDIDRPRRGARRGSSGSPFASRPGPRQRSPLGGSRYRRTSPLSARPDAAHRRGKSRSPQRGPKTNLPNRPDAKPPSGRRGRKTSRSSSSSSGTSNSSSSTSRSSSSSSSSSSSRSRT